MLLSAGITYSTSLHLLRDVFLSTVIGSQNVDCCILNTMKISPGKKWKSTIPYIILNWLPMSL